MEFFAVGGGAVAFVLLVLVLVAVSVGGLVFWIVMLVDAVQVPADHYYKSGTKVTWVLVVALLGWVGALIYLCAGRPGRELRIWLRQMRDAGYNLAAAPAGGAPPGYGAPGPAGPADHRPNRATSGWGTSGRGTSDWGTSGWGASGGGTPGAGSPGRDPAAGGPHAG